MENYVQYIASHFTSTSHIMLGLYLIEPSCSKIVSLWFTEFLSSTTKEIFEHNLEKNQLQGIHNLAICARAGLVIAAS